MNFPRRYLSQLEFQTVFHKISNLLNHRIIGYNVSTGEIISPADLIFGTRKDFGRLHLARDNLTKRANIIQDVSVRFQAAYLRQSFDYIIRRHVWKSRNKRNMELTDVVLISFKDRIAKKGDLRTLVLGVVIKVYPGVDTIVRKVQLAYRIPSHNTEALCA